MPAVTGTSGSSSGSGYAQASISPWDAAGSSVGGSGGGVAGALGGLLDPNLIRQAMLQGLQQRQIGFEEWRAGQEQARQIAQAEEGRASETFTEGQRTRKSAKRVADRERYEASFPKRSATANASARDTAQTQALTGRVPLRRVSVMGAGSFDTPDPLKMTGAQRQQFVPGNAGMSTQPTRMEIGGLGSDLAWQQMIADSLAGRSLGVR